jgi:peptidoglycan/LPS O-acetylase OafA/YrhL
LRPTPSSSPRQDLPALTSLRFGAAFMIFVLHLGEFAPAYSGAISSAAMNQGVSFFFVLSGYVLTHAYGGRALDRAKFFRARFARLYPTHVATLAVILATLPLPAARFENLSPAMSVLSLVSKATMTEAWFPVEGFARSWNSVSWSISAEVAFYLAFPFLLSRVQRSAAATLAGAAVVTLCVYAAGVALGLPVHGGGHMTPTLYHLGTFNPLARGFEFVLGMALYELSARRLRDARLDARAWTAVEAAAIALVALWLALAVPRINDAAEGGFYVWFHSSGSAWAAALLIAALAPGRGLLGRALGARPLVALGEASFAFYMVHAVALRALRQHFGDHPSALAAFALALALAFIVHHGIEKPMRDWIVGAGSVHPRPASAA